MLTDYGRDDVFVGVCEGVLASAAPHARVLHLTHAVPPGDVRAGAVLLAQSVGHLPPAVLLAVVDPGVGTARRGVAVLAGESVFVGPDNGLLPWAADVLGGARAAYALTAAALWRQPVSATFHGRDVFAPVAGRLAGGLAAAEVGEEVDPAGLVRLPPPVVSVGAGRLMAEVLGVDRFGNVQLAATADDLQAAGLAAAPRVRIAPTGEPGGGPADGATATVASRAARRVVRPQRWPGRSGSCHRASRGSSRTPSATWRWWSTAAARPAGWHCRPAPWSNCAGPTRNPPAAADENTDQERPAPPSAAALVRASRISSSPNSNSSPKS